MANGHHLDEGDQLAAGGQQHRSAAFLKHLLRAGLQEHLEDGRADAMDLSQAAVKLG